MLEELLAEIAAKGWLWNNCYQVATDLWRVNLRRPVDDGDWFTDWAEGKNLIEALETCAVKLDQAEFKAEAPQGYSIDKSKPPSLANLLGLTKPINRRI